MPSKSKQSALKVLWQSYIYFPPLVLLILTLSLPLCGTSNDGGDLLICVLSAPLPLNTCISSAGDCRSLSGVPSFIYLVPYVFIYLFPTVLYYLSNSVASSSITTAGWVGPLRESIRSCDTHTHAASHSWIHFSLPCSCIMSSPMFCHFPCVPSLFPAVPRL